MKVQSVWPGGEVELPEFRLAGDPVVVTAEVHRLEACATGGEVAKVAKLEGLAAVILGLARARDEQDGATG